MMGSQFTTVFSKSERAYTGVELRPHFLLTELGLQGTGIGAFVGPCTVKTEHLVDWEDRLANDRIEARRMVHFIGEFFGANLREGVLIQRLFMAVALESLKDSLGEKGQGDGQRNGQLSGTKLRREGDDLYFRDGGGERKLSVSIVTASPVSQLLHVGINIDPAGAPVAAVGLEELQIKVDEWVSDVLKRFSNEWKSMEWACVKVRPVF